MSTKDAKLSYAILAIATVGVLALVAIYADRSKDTKFTENLVRKGTAPIGARSAPPSARQGVTAAQSTQAAGQASQSSLSRTVKVQRHKAMPTAHGGSGPALTRSATTQAAQGAKPGASQGEAVNQSRSLNAQPDGTQQAKTANPAATPVSAANRARSVPLPSAQAAEPSAGVSASLTRAATAQSAQAARSGGVQPSAQRLTRSPATQAAQAGMPAESPERNRAQTAPMQAAQAAAQPTASQAYGKALSRSATAQTAQQARSGQQTAGHDFVRSASTQAAQGAPAGSDARALARTAPSEASRAAQAPIALQRKWDPARSADASPDNEVRDPEDEILQEL